MKTIVLILIIMILVSCATELSIDEDKLLPHQLEFYRYFNNSSLCKKLEIYDSLMDDVRENNLAHNNLYQFAFMKILN